uniref:Immunoglobulin V-set domain-containing protein n=1 Tax=Oryzias sinensis TaxID=183150 RepID=A0A8C7WVX2_9TELE
MHHLQCSVFQEDINCDSSSFQQLCRTETLLLMQKPTSTQNLLCKEICEDNILIDTYRDEDQRGRYSIKYEYRYLKSSILDVTITKLTKSDSGLYTCELQKDWSPISKDNFKIIVTEGEAPRGGAPWVEKLLGSGPLSMVAV